MAKELLIFRTIQTDRKIKSYRADIVDKVNKRKP